MKTDFISKIIAPANIEGPAWWFIFYQQKILLYQDPTGVNIPQVSDIQSLSLKLLNQHYLGTWRHQHCFCAEIVEQTILPASFILQPIRQAVLQLPIEFFDVASRALQILHWDKDHQFCGRCATPLEASVSERAKVCPNCQLMHYPRLSPSIIVAVKRHKEILLARSPHFTAGVYSVLAGFVEPGESAEQAVEREIFEEVGIKIKNLHYRFSQSWPFPHSFLLGFTAEYAAGEIVIDGVEIEDAGWFTRDRLPHLPPPVSISHRLIDLFIKEEF